MSCLRSGFLCQVLGIALLAAPLVAQSSTPFVIDTVFPGSGSSPGPSGLTSIAGTAIDAEGNLYISDDVTNRVFRRTPGGVVTVVAGNGTRGFSGDGGPATAASFDSPSALAVDGAGNLYIRDHGNYRIRRVTPGGVVTTVAGNGHFGGSGWAQGTPATSVTLGNANTLAVDAAGNVYFLGSDYVVRVGTDGLAQTVWSISGSSVAADAVGNLYVATSTAIARRDAASGIATTIHSLSGYIGTGLAAHPSRGLCYGTSSRIMCVSNGQAAPLAGGLLPGYSGDGGNAASAQLDNPGRFTFDAAGNLYFSTGGGIQRVRMINTSNIISTVVQTVPNVSIHTVRHVAVDGAGNLYVADQGSHVVWKRDSAGDITLFAGTGMSGVGADGVPARESSLMAPQGLAVDAAGNVYIAELGAHRVRVVRTNGIIDTVAGSGVQGFGGDNGPARQALLDTPQDVAVDAAGNVYIADSYNNRIRRVTPAGVIHTVAGSGIGRGFNTGGFSGDGGLATAALMNNPAFVTVGASGEVFVSDGNRVRRFQPGGNITTVAGTGTGGFSGDGGLATAAHLSCPAGLRTTAAGELLIADHCNARIRRVDGNGIITTIAGTGMMGDSGDGGPATAAQLNAPYGMAIDGAGVIYVATWGSNKVRRITPGVPCNVTLSASLRILDAAQAAGSLVVTPAGACAFEAVASEPWIHINTGGQGSGPSTLTYSVDTNVGAAMRSGSITVSAAGASATFQVYQTGANCVMGLSTATETKPFYSDELTVPVTQSPAGCAVWSVSTDTPWIQLRGQAVSGGTSYIPFSLANNSTRQKRTGTIRVNGMTYTIVQNESAVYLVNPAAGSTLGSTATFSWAADAGSFSYRYELATADGVTLSSGSAVGNSVTVHGIPANGKTLYFRLWIFGHTLPSGWQPEPIEAMFVATAGAGGSLDFDGNGIPDLLWQHDGTRSVGVWYMGGPKATVQQGIAYPAPGEYPGWRVVGAADMDRNGVLDLIWQHDTTRSVGTWYMGGANGTTMLNVDFQAPGSYPGWRVVAVADMDGNGVPDLVWQNDQTRSVGTWYLGGAKALQVLSIDYQAPGEYPGWRVVGVADMDRNGVPDLVWQHDTTRSAGTWYMGGAKALQLLSVDFQAPGEYPGWRVVGIADMDRNGVPDLVWQHDGTRSVGTWYLSGAKALTVLSVDYQAPGEYPGWRVVGVR
jgi:trimeric autotransporter adhesin